MIKNKKSIKSSFLKSLFNSDFFLLQHHFKQKTIYTKQTIYSKTFLSSLDFYPLLQSLKQFIRIIQFCKKRYRSSIIFKVKDLCYFTLIAEFLKMYSITLNITLEQTIRTLSSSQKLSFLVLLDTSEFEDKNLFNKLFFQNFFLILKINSKFEINKEGTYKIYNDLFDFKKIIFLIVLINKIILKKKKK
jgi:hypothetical protein